MFWIRSRKESRMRKAKRAENPLMVTTGRFLDFSSPLLIPEVWKK